MRVLLYLLLARVYRHLQPQVGGLHGTLFKVHTMYLYEFMIAAATCIVKV